VTGSFGYAQNVQTLLVTYMNSFYNYSGNARRRWGKFNVSAGAGGGSHRVDPAGRHASSSQSYNASIGYTALVYRHRQLLQIERAGAGDWGGPGAGAGALAHSALEPGEPLRRR
jgi:hypothetical protein